MKTIAVLLTVFNRKEKTLQCLHNLLAQTVPEGYIIEVYMVNDGSTDGTEIAVKEQFPGVQIIQGSGHLFWNRGMYLAWETAAKARDYDFYLWLNDDTLLDTNAIKILVQTSGGKENKAIIVGTTCAQDNPQKITYGGRLLKEGLQHPAEEPIVCDYFNGNIVLIPKLVFNTIGMNDPIFQHAFGDFDYGMNAKKNDIKLLIAPGILGECNRHETLPAWCNPQITLKVRLKLLYSPLGNPPLDAFHFEKRHHGLIIAIYHFITNHLRALFPSIWIILNKTTI